MSNRRFDLAVFDFDGTLADTRQGVADTINETLAHFGHSPVAPELVHPHIGLPLETLLRPIVAADDLAPYAARYRERYGKVAMGTTQLVDGVEAALRDLRAAGLKLAIATSEGQGPVADLLEALGIRQLFDQIAVDGAKPDPGILLHVLAQQGVPADRTVMIGDTVFDIVMGRRAGMSTCAVTYGAHRREHLATEQPTYLVDSPSQWLQVVASG